MTGVVTTVLVVTALPLQTAVVTRLPLPGAAPDLVLLVVIAVALAYGEVTGALGGFCAGLLVDLSPPADHAAGRFALAYCVGGYIAGLLSDEARRSTVAPFAVAAGAALAATCLYAGVGALLGDERVTGVAAARGITSSVIYDVVLTPFVLPAVLALARRASPEVSTRR